MTRQQLLEIPVPGDTRTYKAVPLNLLFDVMDEASAKEGLMLNAEDLHTLNSGKKQRLRFGYTTANPDIVLEFAVLNSYDKSMALKIASGASVSACWNGQVMGESKSYLKHSGNVRTKLVDFVSTEMRKGHEQVLLAEEMWKYFNEIELNTNSYNELVGEIFVSDVLQPEQISLFKKELLNPSPKYVGLNKGTVNEVYQACTFAQKSTHPTKYFKSRYALQNFFISKWDLSSINKKFQLIEEIV